MFLKWIFDKLASLFGLLFLSPVLLVVAILIKVKMPGPILFCQKRVGQYGKLFTVYKFRSMTVKAEASVASRDSEATSIASTEQCRITPLGEKLRRIRFRHDIPEHGMVLVKAIRCTCIGIIEYQYTRYLKPYSCYEQHRIYHTCYKFHYGHPLELGFHEYCELFQDQAHKHIAPPNLVCV